MSDNRLSCRQRKRNVCELTHQNYIRNRKSRRQDTWLSWAYNTRCEIVGLFYVYTMYIYMIQASDGEAEKIRQRQIKMNVDAP